MADTSRPLGDVLVGAVRRIERPNWWWIGISLLLWLVLIVLQTWDVRGRLGPAGVAELVGVIVGTGAIALEILRIVILRSFFPAIIIIVLVGVFTWSALRLVASTTWGLYDFARLKAENAARAEAEVSGARLETLQAQMNPHFLFNALNTVASLVRTDAVRAERTVENLADVLRQTLQRSAHPMTTVDDEAEYVRAYLEIERERMGPRLRLTMAIDDAVRVGYRR